MSFSEAASAEDVIDQPARVQFEAFLDEHRRELNGCLDGLTEEQARRSLVRSATTLLGLVKHATFVEKVWFDEAVTRRSRAEIGIPATSDESFIRDVIPGAGRHSPRQPPRPHPAALGVPPHAPRACSALRARRHPPGANPEFASPAMNVGLMFKEQHQTHIHPDWVRAPGSEGPARLLCGL